MSVATKPNKTLIFWTGVLVLCLVLLYIFKAIMLPFVAGLVLGYVLDPATDKLEAMCIPRALSAGIVLLGFFASIVVVFLLLMPVMQQQMANLSAVVPGYLQQAKESLFNLLETYAGEYMEVDAAALGKLGEAYGQDIFNWSTKVLKGVASGGQTLFDILSLLVITPVVAFYLLRDWDILVAKVDDLLPRKHQKTLRGIFSDIDQTLAGFMRGQAIVCVLLGLFYSIALSFAGLEFGLVIGLFIGIISFVPYVGAIFGAILCVGLAILQFQALEPVAIVVAIFAAGQFLEGNVLSPKFVGDNVNLHPVWILFALMAGGAVFGFAGVVIAVPVAAMVGVMVRFTLAQYLNTSYYHGGTKKAPAKKAKKKTTKSRRKAKA